MGRLNPTIDELKTFAELAQKSYFKKEKIGLCK